MTKLQKFRIRWYGYSFIPALVQPILIAFFAARHNYAMTIIFWFMNMICLFMMAVVFTDANSDDKK